RDLLGAPSNRDTNLSPRCMSTVGALPPSGPRRQRTRSDESLASCRVPARRCTIATQAIVPYAFDEAAFADERRHEQCTAQSANMSEQRTTVFEGQRPQRRSSRMQAVPKTPRIGEALGPYRLCVEIGSGGMAIVYLAQMA